MKVEDNRRPVRCELKKLEAGKCFEYGDAILMKTSEWNHNDGICVVDIRKGHIITFPPNRTVWSVNAKVVIE